MTVDQVLTAVKQWEADHPGMDPSDADFGPCVACSEYNSNGGILCMSCAEIYESAMQVQE